MSNKEKISSLRSVFSGQSQFMIHLITDLTLHNLPGTIRVFANYEVSEGARPENLISLTHVVTQEWANQMGQKTLISAETGMGAPTMGLIRPARKNKADFRPKDPLDLNVKAGELHPLVQSAHFLPINCPFCSTFTPAMFYMIVRSESMRTIVPTCALHKNRKPVWF